MKPLLIIIFLLPFIVFSQTDTIYMNSKKISCTVKEINQLEVKFTYFNEELINVINKNSIDKIVFKSGRVEQFKINYTSIKSIEEYSKILITEFKDDLVGCYNLGQITSKAKGLTAWANMKKIQDRAYRKLKIYATMLGGDIIYLSNENIIGNRGGSKYSPGTRTSTNLTGICYSRRLLNLEDFKKSIGSRTNFFVTNKISLAPSSYDYSSNEISDSLLINGIYLDGNYIVVEGVLEEKYKATKINTVSGSKTTQVKSRLINRAFRLIRFSNKAFTLMWEDKSSIFNIDVLLNSED